MRGKIFSRLIAASIVLTPLILHLNISQILTNGLPFLIFQIIIFVGERCSAIGAAVEEPVGVKTGQVGSQQLLAE